MVSRVPTLAVKQVKIPARYVVFVLLGVGTFAAFLISTPWITMAVACVGYLASIPYAGHLYAKLQRKHPKPARVEELEEEEAEE